MARKTVCWQSQVSHFESWALHTADQNPKWIFQGTEQADSKIYIEEQRPKKSQDIPGEA